MLNPGPDEHYLQTARDFCQSYIPDPQVCQTIIIVLFFVSKYLQYIDPLSAPNFLYLSERYRHHKMEAVYFDLNATQLYDPIINPSLYIANPIDLNFGGYKRTKQICLANQSSTTI